MGQRDPDSDAAAPLISLARDAKEPCIEVDAAPALSSKLAPNELAPQVSDPRDVPPELAPLPTLAVVAAYSPIVCAPACDTNIANAAATAAGTISLLSLMAFDLP